MLSARPSRALRVAVLSSVRAPGFAYLLDPAVGRGSRYEIVAFLATDPTHPERARATAAGVPALLRDFRGFYGARGAKLSDLGVRAEFDRGTLHTLSPFEPDLVVLCGYLHLLTRPMLDAFPDRIVNVHDADLTLTEPDGRPQYRGLRSTRDAVLGGATETRTTVHLVTRQVDGGPLLLRSWPYPVAALVAEARAAGANDVMKAYAYAHRGWMMETCWGPLLAQTLRLFATGAVRVLSGRAVVAGRFGPIDLPLPEPTAPAMRRASIGD